MKISQKIKNYLNETATTFNVGDIVISKKFFGPTTWDHIYEIVKVLDNRRYMLKNIKSSSFAEAYSSMLSKAKKKDIEERLKELESLLMRIPAKQKTQRKNLILQIVKLENYLNKEDKLLKAKELKELLNSKCKKFLKETKGDLFYRGAAKAIKTFEVLKPRKDRRPLNTPKELHDFLDMLFNSKFGWKVRSEGVFIMKSKSNVMFYGHSFLFFPIGNYKYVWSPYITDILYPLDTYMNNLFKLSVCDYKYLKNNQITELKDHIKNEILPKYINKDLQNAGDKYEIAFKCDSYVLVNTEFFENYMSINYNREVEVVEDAFKII
ncbi:MAG: hypothetical protein ACOC56_02685 [Atribacterota bacterium]